MECSLQLQVENAANLRVVFCFWLSGLVSMTTRFFLFTTLFILLLLWQHAQSKLMQFTACGCLYIYSGLSTASKVASHDVGFLLFFAPPKTGKRSSGSVELHERISNFWYLKKKKKERMNFKQLSWSWNIKFPRESAWVVTKENYYKIHDFVRIYLLNYNIICILIDG